MTFSLLGRFGFPALGRSRRVAGGGGVNYPARWGLVSNWKLDEASGTRVDSHGANDLTDVNTVTQAEGVLGSAAQFVAANLETLQITDNPSLSLGADIDWWFAAWVYLDTLTEPRTVVWKGTSTGATTLEFMVRYMNSSQRFRADMGDASGAGVTALTLSNSGVIAAETWYHVFIYHDAVNDVLGGSVNNGTADTAATGGKVPNDTAGEFQLGRIGNTTSPHDGRIDSACFGKSPPGGISALLAEIPERLYNSGSGLEYPWT